MKILQRMPLLLVAAGALSCGGPAGDDLSVEPISIESVEVLVLKSLPPQASAHVKGAVGDGCSELHSTSQTRSGSTVTITILRQRPRDAICTQIARLYDEVIQLEGTYPAGSYVVRVNGVERTFTTS